jgi:hypothetical protein
MPRLLSAAFMLVVLREGEDGEPKKIHPESNSIHRDAGSHGNRLGSLQFSVMMLGDQTQRLMVESGGETAELGRDVTLISILPNQSCRIRLTTLRGQCTNSIGNCDPSPRIGQGAFSKNGTQLLLKRFVWSRRVSSRCWIPTLTCAAHVRKHDQHVHDDSAPKCSRSSS